MAKTIEAEALPKAKLFVITPIGGPGTPQRRHADMVFNAAITPACKAVDISPPDRADLIDTTSMISTNIFRNVEEADLAIADLTFLNPNVMYELGIRHAVEKPVIHIAQEGTALPFDTSGHMTLFFDVGDWHSLERLSEQLASAIKHMLGAKYEVSNPLTQARGRKALAGSADSKDQIISDLVSRVDSLERRRARDYRPIQPTEGIDLDSDGTFVDAKSARMMNIFRTRLSRDSINSAEIALLVNMSIDSVKSMSEAQKFEFAEDISKLKHGEKFLDALNVLM